MDPESYQAFLNTAVAEPEPHHSLPVHSCKHCQRIVLRREHVTQPSCRIYLPHTITEVRRAVGDNCELMMCFAAALGPEHTRHCSGCPGCEDPSLWNMSKLVELEHVAQGQFSISLSQMDFLSPDSLALKFWYHNQLGSRDSSRNRMIARGVTGEAASEVGSAIRGSYNADVASNTSLTQMSRWLRECHFSHTLCRQEHVDFMPTRLLQIGSATGKARICLVETLKSQLVNWAALSYVWGGDQPLKTTAASIAEMRAGIRVERLPQTLQDAITVCTALGLSYLWVDALCIIQDDTDDLLQELASMPQIYRRAWVTISASTSASVTEGFLQGRCYSHTLMPISLPYVTDDGSRVGEIVFINDRAKCKHKLEPINSRAWTYQERRLSPRVIDFRHQQVVLYCYTNKQCQGYGSSLGWSNAEKQEDLLYRPLSNQERLLPTWHGIVDDYVTRKLSLPSDKLRALSALADLYKQQRGHTYIAGLWKESLIDDLCWRVDRHEQLLRPKEYRAPSWSWAAIDRDPQLSKGIYPLNDERERDALAIVIDVSVNQEPANTTFGEIRSASLTMEAPVVWTTWKSHSLRKPRFEDPMNCHRVECYADVEEDPGMMEDWVLDLWNTDDLPGVPVLLVLLSLVKEGAGWKACYSGLILTQVSESVYRRVGFFLDPIHTDKVREARAHHYAHFKMQRITII